MKSGRNHPFGKEKTPGKEPKTFAVEFQQPHWQLAFQVHLQLQKPHVRRPSLVVLNRGVGDP
jgi:hypothetical protein